MGPTRQHKVKDEVEDKVKEGRGPLGCWYLIALVLLAAACGSGDSDEATSTPSTDGEAVATESSSTTAAEAPETEAEPTSPAEPAEPAEPTQASLHVFGGVTFEYPSNYILRQSTADNFGFLLLPGTDVAAVNRGEFVPLIGWARVSRTFSGQPVQDTAAFLETVEVAGGGTFEETDESTEVLGFEATRYQVRNLEPEPLFGGQPVGFPGESWWTPAKVSDVYLADLGDSVLALWAESQTEAETSDLLPVLRDLAGSMELTTADGGVAPLPTPVEGVEIDLGPAPDIEPAERKDNGVSTFGEPNFNPPATRQQFLRHGVHMELTLTEDLIIPRHQAGFLVIGDVRGMGPNQLDLQIHMAITGLVPMGTGGVPIGQPLPIDSLEDLIENPPPNLELTNVDTEAEIGGLPGITFDAAIVDSEGCGPVDKPCNYAFMGPLGNEATILGWDHVQRFWVVPDVPNGPLLMKGAGPGHDIDSWLAQVDTMLSTLTIEP